MLELLGRCAMRRGRAGGTQAPSSQKTMRELAVREPAAVSLAASFTVLFAVTWWTGRSQGDDLDDDVAAVMAL